MVYARVPFIMHIYTNSRAHAGTQRSYLALSRVSSLLLCSRVLSSAIALSVARYVNVPLFYVTLQNGFSTARPQHDNQKRAGRTVNRFFGAIKRASSRWLAREHPENSRSNFQMKSLTYNRISDNSDDVKYNLTDSGPVVATRAF